jgi:hypothetical protein
MTPCLWRSIHFLRGFQSELRLVHKVYIYEEISDRARSHPSGRTGMRFLIRVRFPVVSGNDSIRSRSLFSGLKKIFDKLKPEEVYFGIMDGQRNLFLILDIPSENRLPFTLEPFWLDWEADIFITPVMNRADMEKAGMDFDSLLKEWK